LRLRLLRRRRSRRFVLRLSAIPHGASVENVAKPGLDKLMTLKVNVSSRREARQTESHPRVRSGNCTLVQVESAGETHRLRFRARATTLAAIHRQEAVMRGPSVESRGESSGKIMRFCAAMAAFLFAGALCQAQDIPLNVTYLCNGEHIYVENCNIRAKYGTAPRNGGVVIPTGMSAYKFTGTPCTTKTPAADEAARNLRSRRSRCSRRCQARVLRRRAP
jgi:hypothetical protein